MKDVPRSSAGPAVLLSIYFESDLSHSRQALKQLRGRWNHLRVVEGETESERLCDFAKCAQPTERQR